MDAGPELGPDRRVAGRYRINDLIARGGMGSVWHATDETLDREVAIKCVHLENQAATDRALTRGRMLREARIAAKLLHPDIVTVFDVVEHDDPWLILEYVPSRSLAGIITERRTLPPADVAAIDAQIAAARPSAAEAQDALRRIATATPVQIAHEHGKTRVSADEPAGSTIAQRLDPPELPAPPLHAPRRRIVITALIAAAIAATVAVIATRQPTGPGAISTATTTTSAAVPAPDGQIVIADPRSADPCSLIDLTALSQHGSAEIDRANSKFSACRANIRGRANLTVDLLGPDEYAPPGGALQRLGPLIIARFEATTYASGTRTRCERRVALSDGNTVLVSAESPEGAMADDMCAVAETGVTAAVDALFARGIGTRVGLDVERPLARVDACGLIQPADLAAIPGFETATGRPKFGSWGCTWATGSGTRAQLDFWRSTQLTEADVDTDFNGRRGTVFFRPGSHCYAHITWGDISRDDRQWPVDLVRIYAYGSQPEAELCGYARTLANAVAANLPPPS